MRPFNAVAAVNSCYTAGACRNACGGGVVSVLDRHQKPTWPGSAITMKNLHSRSATVDMDKNYEILGVPRGATHAEIKHAYYAKSKMCHPDSPSCSEATDAEKERFAHEFIHLKSAYDAIRYHHNPTGNEFNGSDTGYWYPNGSRRHKGDNTWREYSDRYDFNDEKTWSGTYGPKADFSKRRGADEWRFVQLYLWAGMGAVTFYNLMTWYNIKREKHAVSGLKDEEEIARSFLRQPEFRDLKMDSDEFADLMRLLKSDMDEAERRRAEFHLHNPKEIREEYRWMQAVTTPYNAPDRRWMASQQQQREKAENVSVLGTGN